MKRDNLITRHWMLLVGIGLFVVLHLWGLRYIWSHARLSSTVLAGMLILIVIKHWGLLGSLHVLLRRRPPN
jgi:hypothetical protein